MPPYDVENLDIPSNANPTIFEAIVPRTADKGLFFLLLSVKVGKIKFISFCNIL